MSTTLFEPKYCLHCATEIFLENSAHHGKADCLKSLRPEDFSAFLRGYWDSVQFAYIPEYTQAQIKAWSAGYLWGKSGKGEPATEDYEILCKTPL